MRRALCAMSLAAWPTVFNPLEFRLWSSRSLLASAAGVSGTT